MKKTLMLLILLTLLLMGCSNKIIDNTFIHQDLAFGQRSYHNYTTPLNINIGFSNVYYKIGPMMTVNSKNMVLNSTGTYILSEGYYLITSSLSFSGGNSGLYEFEVFVNDEEKEECSFFRTTTSNALGAGGITCILYLTNNDMLDMRVKDVTPPAQDIKIYHATINILKV